MSISDADRAYALLSANVYGVTNNDESGNPIDRSPLNTLPLPGPEWEILSQFDRNLGSGFLARVYRNQDTGEIVIAYAGTTSGLSDWENGNIPAGMGELASQVIQACALYLDVLNSSYGSDPSAVIRFTGHSLGGKTVSETLSGTRVPPTRFCGFHFQEFRHEEWGFRCNRVMG